MPNTVALFVVLFCFIAYFDGILEARNEEFASAIRQSECIISCFYSWKTPFDLVFLNTSVTEKINDPFQAPDEEPMNMCNGTAELLSCLKSSCEQGLLQYEALSLLTGIHLTYCRSGSDHALAEDFGVRFYRCLAKYKQLPVNPPPEKEEGSFIKDYTEYRAALFDTLADSEECQKDVFDAAKRYYILYFMISANKALQMVAHEHHFEL